MQYEEGGGRDRVLGRVAEAQDRAFMASGTEGDERRRVVRFTGLRTRLGAFGLLR